MSGVAPKAARLATWGRTREHRSDPRASSVRDTHLPCGARAARSLRFFSVVQLAALLCWDCSGSSELLPLACLPLTGSEGLNGLFRQAII